jgi:hypothetical protein
VFDLQTSNQPRPIIRRTTTMFIASEHNRPGKVNILLISSGSVASIKIPLIVKALLEVRSFQTTRDR